MEPALIMLLILLAVMVFGFALYLLGAKLIDDSTRH